MATVEIFAHEGDQKVFIRSLHRLNLLDIVNEDQVKEVLVTVREGTGHPLSYEEAAKVTDWMFKTLLQTSILESVCNGNIDIDASGPELTFGSTKKAR